MCSSFQDNPRLARAFSDDGGGWRAVNGDVGGGRQRATADADKALALEEQLKKMK